MVSNAFSAGIVPGGLRDKSEIKILICYIMDKIKNPLKKSDVALALQTYGLANYFEVSDAFSEMLSGGSILKQGESGYVIGPQGKMIVEELSKTLPSVVRDRAIQAIRMYVERTKAEKENKVIIKENEFGFDVTCIVSDGSFEMLKLTLYAPDREAANKIKSNFYKNPGEIYAKILVLMAD